MRSQKKAGIAISYASMALNMAISLLVTPFLIKSLGHAEYGVYRIIQSFGGQLMILNFGVGTVATRYVARFNALRQDKEKENYLFMAVCLAGILTAITVFVGWLMHFGIEPLFAQGLTIDEIRLARILFTFLIATTAVSVFRDVFRGAIVGEEHFIAANGIVLLGLLLRAVTLVILLMIGFGSIAIVATDFALAVLTTFMYVIYSRVRLQQRVRFHNLDWGALRESVTFAGALFLQSVVNQVNMTVDIVILGAVLTKNVTQVVTMYSLALVLYTMYSGLTTIVGSVFMPHAVHMVTREASSSELTDLVIRIGRYQMIVAGAVLGGFALFGRTFLVVWVGQAYTAAYVPALMIMIPVTIPLIQSAAVSILDAQLKRMVRSVALVGMAALNILISVLLVQRIGYIGAAIGTALSVFLGHGVFMNWYYHKHIGLEVPRAFRETFRGILPAAVIATSLCIPIALLIPDTLTGLGVGASVFLSTYAVLLYKRALSEVEIGNTFGMVRRLLQIA